MEKLPLRLLAVAEYIDHGDKIADIGSDHGLLPIYLAAHGHGDIYASDNKKGPYNRLQARILTSGFQDKIEVQLADGLDKLPSKIDTIVIAGMGGDLIASILSLGQDHLDHIKKLILVPHGAEPELRKVISYLGFSIQDEQVIEEDDKFYEVIYATNEPCFVCGIDSTFGPVNIRKKTPTFIKKWTEEHSKLENILQQPGIPEQRKNELNGLKKLIYDVITTKGDQQDD